MLNLSAFWYYAQPAAALPGAEVILGLQCIASSLQEFWRNSIARGGFFVSFAGTIMMMFMLLSKGLVISLFCEAFYTLLFMGLQLHLWAALGYILCVLRSCSMSFL